MDDGRGRNAIMKAFDIAPFALPNTAPNEVRFEQPRDIRRVVVRLASPVSAEIGLSYLHKTWPQTRHELPPEMGRTHPCQFGWRPLDDWFNATWRRAAVQSTHLDERTLEFTFAGLHAEFAEYPGREVYDVTFRRTLGVRVEAAVPAAVQAIEVYTESAACRAAVRVELDAGRRTPGGCVTLSGYNLRGLRCRPLTGVEVRRHQIILQPGGARGFLAQWECMVPAHPYSDDDALLTLSLEGEVFTVALAALREQGPIWFAESGVFITAAADPTTFAQYQARNRGVKTIRQQVLEAPEQSLSGAFHGQPRAHAVAYTLGCKHARQRFWIEPNGDIVLNRHNVMWTPGADSERFGNEGNARFFFDLGDWIPVARYTDPAPAFAWNLQFRHGSLVREQRYLATPLRPLGPASELAGDDTVVLLVRLSLHNAGAETVPARLPLGFSGNSGRSGNRLAAGRSAAGGQDDDLVPRSARTPLTATPDGRLLGVWQGLPVLRGLYESDLTPRTDGDGLVFEKRLAPGESAELVLRIPFIVVDREDELQALRNLHFGACDRQALEFWRAEARQGAQVVTPNAHLNALHTMHALHVQVTDHAVPGKPHLINTSVGASTYGNFSNESCMIIDELDQRGLHEEARRRIELWLEYQGTVGLNGRFSDIDGVFYGAGGFEQGQSYCQHHGWVLWIIAKHYAVTGDARWLRDVAAAGLCRGLEWVFRQRQHTLQTLPHSRGWERGFLPAGGLEDVDDYCYWLSTNALTWRGCDAASAALEAIAHPDAARFRQAADAYRQDLIRGFETMRRLSPLVRLRDGRWVPHYPSRLYCRGRDRGWIRETLEGAVYLLISGLFASDSPQAAWILDDFQDNLYMNPPFGYYVDQPANTWFDRGGVSIQPNLLAGLMPHLERDEVEVYLWMFFNCWNACYREEITAMVEHPYPVLGFSNSAHFKTSDEANAVKWLQHMFVYATPTRLHLGRAIPRDWLRAGRGARAEGLQTPFGTVSVAYAPQADGCTIEATVKLALRAAPAQTLVRFRTPGQQPLRTVTVNERSHPAFDAVTGDVDVSGCSGDLVIRISS
jgi:hypothetical protein